MPLVTHRPKMENGIMARILGIPCLADKLPAPIKMIASHGKLAAMGTLAFSTILCGITFPFWALSKLISEIGVYGLLVGLIFIIGRGIIRMIAFPGASRKVAGDIEGEFAKYSIRMIEISCTGLYDLASILCAEDVNHSTLSQLPQLWERTQNHRNRILGVFLDVLSYLQQDNSLVLTESSSVEPPSVGPFGPDYTRFGNNRLTGDLGSLSTLSTKARLDGVEFHKRLTNIIALIDDLSIKASEILQGRTTIVPETARSTAAALKSASVDLRDYVTSLSPRAHDDASIINDSTDQMRRALDSQSSNGPMDAVRAVANNVGPMIDPPPQSSIFGLDLLRGCTLSRYRGASQFWVRRPTGGMVDVLRFPATQKMSNSQTRRAVLYCNPNAGMIEVSTGINFAGGNVPTVDTENVNNDSWVDFYTELGFDVYVFNYAGYGRSFGPTGPNHQGDHRPGCLARIGRILKSALYSFQPTPDTLREDGIAVATHLISAEGVQQLVIHGESIGGVSAAGTSRHLSNSPIYHHKISLLICDRTFCNLEAIAQRMVGGWSGYAIRVLAPLWNTDVASDYVATSCPKILASDAADVIIAEASSLKSGVALWKEVHRSATAKGLGWIPDTPVHYRMADFENCCVNEQKFRPINSLFRAQPPTWPQDKHMSYDEVFHFAACCRRIAKNAKLAAQNVQNDVEDAMGVITEFYLQPPLMQAWITLACCDGLTGPTLGTAVKTGYDTTLTWLCSCLTFGGQVVLANSGARTGSTTEKTPIEDVDFDLRPNGFELEEQAGSVVYPKPIPEVLEQVLAYSEIGDDEIAILSHEFQFVVGTLHYLCDRLKDQSHRSASQSSDVGTFLNLNCGHNNPFSREEQKQLSDLLQEVFNNSHTIV